ncbi:hypothetical protein HY546_03035 [archaeon]|nr:hypothetical protein [archaeon]
MAHPRAMLLPDGRLSFEIQNNSGIGCVTLFREWLVEVRDGYAYVLGVSDIRACETSIYWRSSIPLFSVSRRFGTLAELPNFEQKAAYARAKCLKV